jgi:hypothetical protein
VVKKTQKKIVKQKTIKKKVTRLSPKKKVETPKVAKGRIRVFYKVKEDAQIVEALKNTEKTKTEIAKELAKKLNRSQESLRDRMKRFISRMNPTEMKDLLKEAEINPEFYVHFQKPTSGYRKIDKVMVSAPIFQNVKKLKKKKVQPKTSKQNNRDEFAWLKSKLKDNDPYFSVDHGVQFLNCILNELENTKHVTEAQVKDLIKNVDSDMTLEDIFNNLNVKRSK